MKIRLAKKIMNYNPNGKLHKGWHRRFMKLRPPYKREDGVTVFPSCHDIDIVRRARKRLLKWIKNKQE